MLDRLYEDIVTKEQEKDESKKLEVKTDFNVINITNDCFQPTLYKEEKHMLDLDSYRLSVDKVTIPDSADFVRDIKDKRVKITDYAIMCGASNENLDGVNYGNLWLKSKGDINANVYTADRHFKRRQQN